MPETTSTQGSCKYLLEVTFRDGDMVRQVCTWDAAMQVLSTLASGDKVIATAAIGRIPSRLY
jgi:hypothetical protein